MPARTMLTFGSMVGGDAAGRSVAGVRAEVGVEIFELGGPGAGESPFDAGAGGPADRGVGIAADRRFDLQAGEGGAAGDVGHEVVPGVADAAARRREPGVLDGAFAAAAGDGVAGVALDQGVVDVAFQAPDPVAGLQIVAKRGADQPAVLGVGGEVAEGVRHVGIAPGIAAVETDVETGPTERGDVRHHRCLIDGSGQIGRERWHCHRGGQ